jgi:hypothetical protein
MRCVQRRTGMAIIHIRMRCTAHPPYEPLHRLANLRFDLFPHPSTRFRNFHPLPFCLKAFNTLISTLAHSSRDDTLPSSLQNVTTFLKARSRQLSPSLKMREPHLSIRLTMLLGPKMAIVRPWVHLARLNQHAANVVKYRRHHSRCVSTLHYQLYSSEQLHVK